MKNIDYQTEFWNKILISKPFSHQISWENFTKFVEQSDCILDYGCGYGRITSELFNAGYKKITGTDPAGKMIKQAKAQFPGIEFTDLSPDFIRLNSAKFDVILLFGVLNCIPTDSGQLELIQNISRLLKKKGILYISDFLLQTDQRNRVRYEAGINITGNYGVFRIPEGAIFRHHFRDWIKKLTQNFAELQFENIRLKTMNNNPALGFQYFGQKY